MITEVACMSNVPRSPGIYPTPELDVPVGTTRIGLALERITWADMGAANVISVRIEISLDGVNWFALCEATSRGGVTIGKDGQPIPRTTIMRRLPWEIMGMSGLKARAFLNVFGDVRGQVFGLFDDEIIVRPSFAHASVAYDNDAETSMDAVSSATISTFAVGNNTNRYMIVGIGSYPDTVARTSVTYGGVGTGWSELTTRNQASGQERASLWGKAAPAVGSADVVLTMGANCTGGVNALSAYNVDQATPTGTPGGNDGFNSTAITCDVTAAVGDLVYDSVHYYAGVTPSITVDASQVQRSNQSIGNHRVGQSTEAGAATVTMSWTGGGSTEPQWAQAAIALKMAQEGGASASHILAYKVY